MDIVQGSKEFYKGFYQSWLELTMETVKNSAELAGSAWKVESYGKFYQKWMNSMKGAMDRILRMPGFASNGWQIFKSTTAHSEIIKEMTELQLRQLEIPSHADLDELSERISYLDDQLEQLKNTVRLLEGKGDTKAPAKKKAASPEV